MRDSRSKLERNGRNDGVQSLAIRPGTSGINFEGADIFYITGISSKLGSVNTSLVLPPQ